MQKSSASTTWVRIRLLEHGDMDGFRILDESENIKNPLRVRLGSCAEKRQKMAIQAMHISSPCPSPIFCHIDECVWVK